MFSIRKTDKYLTKIFLKSFFYILISFQFINIIMDLFDRLDMFVDNNVKLYTYFYYYLLKTPYLISFMIPIAVIISTILTLHKIIKNNEILIMFNAGLSFIRITFPIIILSFFISIITFGLNELIIPESNYAVDKLEAKIKNINFDREGDKHNFSFKGEKFFYNIEHFVHQKNLIKGLLIEKIDNNKVIYRLSAKKAKHYKEGWLSEDVYIKLFNQKGQEYHIQIKQPIKHLILDISETPSDFGKNIKQPDEMNFIELTKFIEKKDKAGLDISKYLVELHMKFSFSLLPFLVCLLGLGIIIIKPELNLVSLLGISLGTSFIFWGIFATFKSLGTAGKLSPVLAAWLPDILLLALSFILIFYKQDKTFK